MAVAPKERLLESINYTPPKKSWWKLPVIFRKGTYCNPALPGHLEYLGLPNPRSWSPSEEDWKLPENWKEIVLKGMKERLNRYRSFRLFMDICVRCGACTDKCHFFIGTGDPRNMPVLRAELLRSIYRRYFTLSGRILRGLVGARDLTEDVIKEWFYYFYQCTECRRCSVFCPYGIDTCEITMMARELLNLLGLNIHWILDPVRNCYRTGNHLGVVPDAFVASMELIRSDIKEVTGIDVEIPINRKGAEILFVPLSADYFGQPHWFALMGVVMLFHEIGLDYTFSTYASEGGNFGLFHSYESMKRLSYKIYAEAKRLKVKWILGGECGHMWRVMHQYLDTLHGPPDFLEVPSSPITGTVFENARSTKMVHICEFTADLIYHNKLKLDKSRNDHWKVTYHDSCNPSRSMGLLEEPRYIIRNVCNYFYEMPENTIREKTFCCGGGAGLGADENTEMKLRGGFPRAYAAKYVNDRYGVNFMACICAIDKANLTELMRYWVPEVQVGGIHELVGNALVMRGEKERMVDLRFQPIKQGSKANVT